MRPVIIYSLSDPTTNQIRYVGKTVRKLLYRLKEHINFSKKGKTHVSCWIKGLLKQNKLPIIECLDIVKESEWMFWEEYWIGQINSWGFNLTNISKGGNSDTYLIIQKNTRIKKVIRKINVYDLSDKLLETLDTLSLVERKYKLKHGPAWKCLNGKNSRCGNIILSYSNSKKLKKYSLISKVPKLVEFRNRSKITIFNSISEACKSLGFSRGAYNYGIKTGIIKFKGYKVKVYNNKTVIKTK